MKKKGFTLVEILAVVIIIGILALLVTPLILETIESSNKKTYDEQVKRIHDIANIYASENTLEYINGVATVTIGDLSAEGYIKLPVKNPITKENFPEDYAVYFYQNGVFTCGNDFIDTRDDKKYETLQIGDQCWFAEDLAYNDGCLTRTWAEAAPYHSCVPSCCGYSGLLYQWNAAMNQSEEEGAQGLCPAGWHIPTDAEWMEMEISLGMDPIEANNDRTVVIWRGSPVGAELKAIGITNPYNWNGTDLHGFTGVPAGYGQRANGAIGNPGRDASYWTSTVNSPGSLWIWYRGLWYTYNTVGRSVYRRADGFSIRCLKD